MPRHHSRSTASSSEHPVDPVAAAAMLTFENSTQQDRSHRLSGKPFGVYRIIDWGVLSAFGQAEAVREFLSTPGWNSLFAISETAFLELTVEFLASFEFHWAAEENYISFRMGGVVRRLSIRELNVHMGFCDEAFSRSPAYADLRSDFPTNFNVLALWMEISNDITPYTPKKSKGSHLISPAFRILHNLLTFSLTGRDDSHGVVTKRDLLCLYSLYHRVPLNLGLALAVFFRHQAENARLGAVHGGNFITHLAKRMGLWDTFPRMTAVQSPMSLQFQNLQALGLARRRDGEFEAIPPAVVGGDLDFHLGGDFGGAARSPRLPSPSQPSSSAPGTSTSWDQHFGLLHTRIDQMQTHFDDRFNQIDSRFAQYDDRFTQLERRHASSMEHISREFEVMRSFYQQPGNSSDEE